MSESIGLYIHIPYCLSKCAYCDFYSVTDNESYKRYADALIMHMEDYSSGAANRPVDSVFFGGGTPSALPKATMLSLINGIYSNFHLTEDAEFTIEMNPATVGHAELKTYLKAGVNRISIGMQSANNRELELLSRIHTYEEFEKSYYMARDAGFTNINVDVMYGIPEQTTASLMNTLTTLCELKPDHISLYGLKIEDGTPFAAMKSRGELKLPDEDTEFEMYCRAVEFLEKYGYKQYEISNFARTGKQCRHNLKYWNCEEYIGLGAGAHSYFNNRRFSFKKDINAYVEAMENPGNKPSIISENYEIRPNERIGEYVMLQLRLRRGIDSDQFAGLFGVSFERLYGKYLDMYISNGFMEKRGNRYAFTLKGMYVSNYILSAMLDFQSELVAGIADGTDR